MSDPEPGQVFLAPPIVPLAPYTSTIRYPLQALLTLARSIINDLYDHHQALREAALEAENEDEEAEEVDNLGDIQHSLHSFDLKRWKAIREEVNDGDYEWDATDHARFNDPSLPEESLLNYGRTPKAEWVSLLHSR